MRFVVAGRYLVSCVSIQLGPFLKRKWGLVGGILGFFSEKTQYRWSVPCVSMQLTLSLCRFK